MFSNTIRNATDVVRFGMPIDGYSFGATVASEAKCALGAVVRDGRVADVRTLVQGFFPGTSAWRPPIS